MPTKETVIFEVNGVAVPEISKLAKVRLQSFIKYMCRGDQLWFEANNRTYEILYKRAREYLNGNVTFTYGMKIIDAPNP
jgi:hypothetical protein